MTAPDPAATRVMTWNLWARHDDWRRRAAAISATIDNVNPDVLALQEAWLDEDTGTSQAVMLARRHGYHHSAQHHPAAPQRGLALLSRWPIVDSESVPLPPGAAPSEHRSALVTTVDTAAGPRHLYVTHLNAGPDHGPIRRSQLTTVAHHVYVHTSAGSRTVICGDLNAEPESDELRMMTGLAAPPAPGVVFQDAWTAAPHTSGPGYTWDNRNPHAAAERLGNARLDYILVRLPTERPRGAVLDAQVIDGVCEDVTGSDHSAFVATVDLS